MKNYMRTFTTNRHRTEKLRRVRCKVPGKGHLNPFLEPASRRRWVEDVEVIITMDMERVFETLAYRAIEAKTGKATLMDGRITAKIIKRTERAVTVTDIPLSENYVLTEEQPL